MSPLFRNVFITSLSALAFSACDKKAEGPQPDRSPGRPSVPARPKVAPKTPEVEVSKARAEAFFATWEKALVAGDAPELHKLYADAFHAYRHDGGAPVGRDAWVASVKASDATVSLRSMRRGASTLIFDVVEEARRAGVDTTVAHRLVVADRDGKLRVEREDIFTGDDVETGGNVDTQSLMPVVHDRYVLLATETSPEWERVAPTLSQGALAERGISDAKIPASVRAWVGRDVIVTSSTGKTCNTKVKGLRVVADATLPELTVAHWDGKLGGKGVDRRVRAAQAYGLVGPEGKYLMGRLEKSCPGGLVALASGSKAASTIPAREDAYDAEVALAYRALPGWQRLQKRAELTGRKTFWDEADGRHPVVRRFDFPQKSYVSVSSGAGSLCEGNETHFWAIFELEGGEHPRIATSGEDGEPFDPELAVSINGELFFASTSRVLGRVEQKYRFLSRYLPPVYADPCAD